MKIRKNFLFFFLFAFFSLKSQSVDIRDNDDYVFVTAHRGDWIFAPENSLKALENAITLGVDIMETDVWLTKDDQLVIMHDKTLDRTTNGTGKIAEKTLAEIKTLRLKNGQGILTNETVPTLEEYILAAKGRIYLYLDKAGQVNSDKTVEYKLQAILALLKKHQALGQAIFVLDMPYSKAYNIFGEDLKKIIYCPVVEDGIKDLDNYISEYRKKLKPLMYQFRIKTLEDKSYSYIPKLKADGTKLFVAATWAHHTAGHDDFISIEKGGAYGWQWLINQGFTVIETNYPHNLINYLKTTGRRARH